MKQIEQRLNVLGASKSAIKDGALKLGALNWSLFFKAQSDTPAKLLTFVYALLHLEIAGYELLKRTALRATDPATMTLCEDLLAETRAMAEELVDHIRASVATTLND